MRGLGRPLMATFLRVSSTRVINTYSKVLRVVLVGSLRLRIRGLIQNSVLRRLGVHLAVFIFKVRHVFRDLFSFLRNITVLLASSRQSLNLHFAVYISHEILLDQKLIVSGKWASHNSWRLLHITPCSRLLGRWRILLQLIHLVDQHNIFHIGHLSGLLLYSLMLRIPFLLHLLDVLVDLFLGSRTTGAS